VEVPGETVSGLQVECHTKRLRTIAYQLVEKTCNNLASTMSSKKTAWKPVPRVPNALLSSSTLRAGREVGASTLTLVGAITEL